MGGSARQIQGVLGGSTDFAQVEVDEEHRPDPIGARERHGDIARDGGRAQPAADAEHGDHLRQVRRGFDQKPGIDFDAVSADAWAGL